MPELAPAQLTPKILHVTALCDEHQGPTKTEHLPLVAGFYSALGLLTVYLLMFPTTYLLSLVTCPLLFEACEAIDTCTKTRASVVRTSHTGVDSGTFLAHRSDSDTYADGLRVVISPMLHVLSTVVCGIFSVLSLLFNRALSFKFSKSLLLLQYVKKCI